MLDLATPSTMHISPSSFTLQSENFPLGLPIKMTCHTSKAFSFFFFFSNDEHGERKTKTSYNNFIVMRTKTWWSIVSSQNRLTSIYKYKADLSPKKIYYRDRFLDLYSARHQLITSAASTACKTSLWTPPQPCLRGGPRRRPSKGTASPLSLAASPWGSVRTQGVPAMPPPPLRCSTSPSAQP